MHTLTEYAPRASTLSTEQPGDTAAATAEEGMGDLPASSSTSLVQLTRRSGAEVAEEESAIARRSNVEALFRWSEAEASLRRETGLQVIKDFFSRLFGWEEKTEEHSHDTTTQAPFSSSPDKEVLSALGNHYAFMFGWDADALKEWQSERTRRWEMLDMLRDRPENQHSAEVELGSDLAASFGWDEEALVEWDEKREKRRELFDKLSGSYRRG